ncbi:MAG: riboflavin synthase [Thermogemmatispora sp.]|uniref:riboflavin synthase n=1 Tax=Thermogemmatispora sp. TaxID=1968838 RepID=UPI0019E9683F|nr:riboflavin synthase [Thermogemmatispora sp.]MBE3568130.1 riboflavin synthase [Thermogemmatispora sp.]
MFTGIVEEVGTVLATDATTLEIAIPAAWPDVKEGDSIAVDGACLTVVARGEHWLRVEVMPETLRRTRFASLIAGERSGQDDERAVNLERSLPVGGRFGGHIVQGHVEAVVTVLSTREEGNSLVCEMTLPVALRPYIVPKGFVALNGVSLTVVSCQGDRFSVALIPYTRTHTNLGRLRPGSLLNLESDILGRYLVQLVGHYAVPSQLPGAKAASDPLDWAFPERNSMGEDGGAKRQEG